MRIDLVVSTLLDVLSQEVYGSVHVNGADEWDQFEVELLGREREQERAVLEDLLHAAWNGALD
jgi:hypothetical protein